MLKKFQLSWHWVGVFPLFWSAVSFVWAENAPDTTQFDSDFPKLQFVFAQKQEVIREQVVDGVVEAVNKATIKAQTAGQIESINFDVDDYVEQGQVLARIRAEEQKASTAQIEAQLAEAKAYYDQARTEFNRVNKIYKKGALSASQRDKARADLNAAKARLTAARAATKRTKTQQDYTEIKAPYSGVVAERHIELGEIANVGAPIMTGMSLDQLRVITYVSQSQIAAIRHYKKARILLTDSLGEIKSYDAAKLVVAPQADQVSHTFKVRIDLPEKIQNLFPGMYVKVAFAIGEDQVFLLPDSAVAYRGDMRAIYVKNQQGGLSMYPVRLGVRHKDMVEVLSGISTGEQIALDPVAAAISLKEHFKMQTKVNGGH